MKLLHKIIFWTHLLAGVTAGTVIFIMSFTGVVLMYEPQISEYSERSARWVVPGPETKRLSFDELVAKVGQASHDIRPAAIIVKSDPAASVAVNLGRENTVFVNPYSGEILGGLSATHNFLHDVVDWHRWRHGATRFYPRVDCDVDYDTPAAGWINGVLVNLQQESFTAASA